MEADKVIKGKIERIGSLTKFGKMWAQSVLIDGQWYSAVGFNKSDVTKIIDKAEENKEAFLHLKQRGEYWNIIDITYEEPERTEEKITASAELNDIAVFKKCLDDALNIYNSKLTEMFPDPYANDKSVLKPEKVVDIAIALFNLRNK